jgi:hypothetical protein
MVTGSCEEIDVCISTITVTNKLIAMQCKLGHPTTRTPPASIDRSQLVLRTVDVERLIDDDHSARSIWQLMGRVDLSLFYAKIAAVEGGLAVTTPHRY